MSDTCDHGLPTDKHCPTCQTVRLRAELARVTAERDEARFLASELPPTLALCKVQAQEIEALALREQLLRGDIERMAGRNEALRLELSHSEDDGMQLATVEGSLVVDDDLTVSGEDFDHIRSMIENPPPPAPGLIDALKRTR